MTEADITQEEFNAELVNESYESASSSSILHTANDTSLAAMTGPDAEYTDSEPVTALVDPVTSMQPDDSQASSSREDNKENFNFSAKPPHSAGDMETYTELSSPIQSTNLEPPGRSPPHPSVQSPRSATPRSDGEESPGGSVRRSESGRGRTSRVDSLQRKEREEKVRATKEKLDRDKEKKLQELIDSQKQAEELRLKQQILRKKKIDEMKNKDEERQRAAEERRKKREADEEERRQNFMKKRIERYAQADAEARVRKGKHESYGFGSSAPRFEEILLTSSPAARSSSQLNVSVHRTQDAIDGGSDNDSPRPGSASMEPTPLIFAARPLSKSTTNLSVPRRAPSTERPRKSTANYSNRSTADVRLSLQSRNRASFSPVALIGSTPPAGRSQERSKGAKGSALPPKISSAPAPKLNAELSPNLQSSVARLSAPRVASQTDEKRSKTSASSSGVPPSAIRKALSTTQLNRPEVKKAPLKTRSERSASTLSQRSMTSADVSRLGQTKDTPGRRSSDRPRSATRPTTSRVADRMTRSVTGPATSTDSDSGKKPSPSKGRSLSATRPHSTALDKKPAPPRAAAAKPKTADVMSRSMYAPSTSAKLAAKTEAKQIMKKAVSVGNVSKSALTVKKDTPTRPILKSKSAEPVKDSTSPRTQTTHTTATKPIVKTTVTKTKPSTDSKPSTTKPISKQPTKLATDSKPSTTKPISKQPTKLATDSKPSTTKPISKQPTKLATDSKPSSLKPSSSKTTPDTSRRSSGDSGKAPKQMTEEPPKGPEVVTEEQKEETTPADTPATTETPATTGSPAEQPEVQAPAAVTEVEKKPEEQAAVKPDTEKVEEKIEKAESVTMPAAAEASKPKSAKEAQMDEYKAKLAEKRREAREKAEREAEAERQRVEAERLAEEEREREEEERQLAFEAEQMKLAAEARQLEQERLEVAIAEAEQRRLEETERLEVERIQKEQAVESARQEAEVAKKQREEKIAREEQEKLERKKKLEMIMARVKTASPTPDKVMTESSPAVMTTSMTSSQSSTFKSPLLAGLMGNKENKTAEGGSEKKFASSLLNNIMAKVSADRSEDTSAASSTGNSGSTSPEHKVSPSTSTLNTSSIEPQTQPDSAIVNTEQKSSNSVEPSTLVHKNGHVENAPFYVDDEVTPHVENKSIVSSKTDLNGASNGLHTNGDLSAGAQAETNFEQVIALDDSAPAVMPPVSEPYQAFTDESSNHVEEVH